MKFSDFPRSENLIPIALDEDLSWNGGTIPEGSPTDWILFAPGHAQVSPETRHHILGAAMNRPDASLFYADDVAAGERILNRLNLKPDFDRTLLASQDYIGAPVAVRRKMLIDVGGVDQTRGTAVLYDLVLRVAEAGGVIARITEVLIGYKAKRAAANDDDRQDALMARKEFTDISINKGSVAGLLVQKRRFSETSQPAITIIIPTRRAHRPRSAKSYIEILLTYIAQASWPMDRITVIVGDDIVGEPEWSRHPWPFKLKRVETPRAPNEAFNYSAKMNRLWRESKDEHIIFLNDDVAPLSGDWISALLTFSVQESVGGVGARLQYDDGSIQHAGMFPSLRTVVHAWLGWPAASETYRDYALAQREWSMVTGAVFATRMSILEQTNGFDERFSLEFNDVDLCLRIRNLGRRIVYNPEALFTHSEKASRGETLPPGDEVALFLSRWSRWLEHDPSSHPDLSQTRLDVVADGKPDDWYL